MQYEYKTKPFEHQEVALKQSCEEKNWGYLMEMGCGKSKVLIDNAAYLYEAGKIDTLIVVAPKGVYRNWVLKEVPQHMPDRIEHRMYTWRSTANKAQQKELIEALSYDDGLRILVINVEAFASAKVTGYLGQFIRKDTSLMLAVDESTTIKNPKAKRTKALTAVGRLAKYKRILTGSPVTKSPMDLFSQCAFMSPDLLGYSNYYAYQNRYAVTRRQRMGAHSFEQIVGYRNLDELSTRLSFFTSRVLKKDCLDLPEKTYLPRYVALSPEQVKYYRSIKENAIALLDNGKMLTAPQVMTQLVRLQQVLCGYLVTDDGETTIIPNRRIDALLETVEEMDGKVIIWSRFRKDIMMITEKLNQVYGQGSAGSYFGDTSDDDREALVLNFQNPDHGTRFFVGNPQTAGYGLTLTEANNVIYYANDFNLETRVQSEDRCHRIGQTKAVTYVDLIAEGTVDEHIVKSLTSKIKLAGAALGEEMREWLKLDVI